MGRFWAGIAVSSACFFSELLTPAGISFGGNGLLSFPASSSHCFLGPRVGYPQEGSPQATDSYCQKSFGAFRDFFAINTQ